jgi:hypothetical protein
MAGLVAGLVMALFLALTGLLSGTPLLATLGYFDPGRAGSWLTGALAHLAVSAIYGLIFGLLLRLVIAIRPSLWRLPWLWGAVYGLMLLGLARGVVLTAVASPLVHIAAWQLGLAHLLYGLVLGLWLSRNQ